MSYKSEFFDKLATNLVQLQDKLTVDEQGHLTRSIANTCHFARALHDTFSQMKDVGIMLAMGAACDYSPIKKES